MKTDYRGQFAEGEIEARTLLDVIDAQAAEIERLRAALRRLYCAINHRHYGRMPEEVQIAFDAAGNALGDGND